MVVTRLQRTQKEDAAIAEFTPEFFDASSRAWLANKRKCVNCTYKYICQKTFSSGKQCGRTVYKTEDLCRQHWALGLSANAAVEKKKEHAQEQETSR